ncbi:magnesium chelatase subunit D [Jiella sp. CQZ9-1]|uniref:Magnesium chelatase subunit D n=1 Tax=Jiella flava TaxID=2816857 RepID=A0A939FWX9_9HYPH|nr:magnesium chelatase subunit D [Jiella flava]
MESKPDDGHALWLEAVRALALLAVDPGIGLRLAGRTGPVQRTALEHFNKMMPAGVPSRKMPAGTGEAALLGGLDLPASLAKKTPVLERGLIAAADGGILIAAMAERMTAEAAGLIGLALDRGCVSLERDGMSATIEARIGVLALDEGFEPDEAPPPALCERLGLWLSLDGADPRGVSNPIASAKAITAARRRLPGLRAGDAAIETLCQAAMAFGIVSLRAPHLAIRAALASAALAGRAQPDGSDVETAIRLVLLPRAVTLPEMPAEPQPDEADTPPETLDTPPSDDKPAETDASKTDADPQALETPDDVTLDAAAVRLPEDLLRALLARARPPLSRGAGCGRRGAFAARARRGRVVGTRPGDPRRERLDLIATLRAAAPWQPIHRARQAEFRAETQPEPQPHRLDIRAADLRVRRYKGKAETATIFAVDASGSAALARLAEAKGAVERILAECYVRRDRVALVAFRGTRADVLLTETKSLTRAKRSLAALPAGGGTPLASGILSALDLAKSAAREGRTPLITLLTDGRANIARNGAAGRPQATQDAHDAARAVRSANIAGLVIDLSQRPSPEARQVAEAMGARYLALPRADSAALAAAVATTPRGVAGQRTVP